MILGPILDHIFDPKKDKLFCPVLVFCRGTPNAICDLVLYLQSEGLNISWIYPGTVPSQYLKTVFAMQSSTLSLTGSQIIFLKWDGSIWDLGVKFRQKRIHLRYRNFSLAFIFLRAFEAIASPLNLESSWQPRYSTISCCLMEWPAKYILISFKPLVFENRMDLVLSSPKWSDSLLSMNHWHNHENYLFKTFSIFLTSSCW